ncbi:MAG: hypothetical protein PHU23_01400 [Dehalococcoidales bacterium]|nr:hypothetical protein [Dehalococcoidales bacterium]
MEQSGREAAEREIIRAITADEQANTFYYQVIKRFVSGGPANPKGKFGAYGLKEIDAAWLKLNDTGKKLRRAYMKLYSASL